MSRDSRYHLFSSVLGPSIIHQIAAELIDEKTYHQWLTENSGSVERIVGKQGRQLREILPKIGGRYRQLIITWASDPQTLPAMASLLKSALTLVN